MTRVKRMILVLFLCCQAYCLPGAAVHQKPLSAVSDYLRSIWPFGSLYYPNSQVSSPIRTAEKLVIRFNITNAVELAALNLAADKYFWDVWDRRDSWADFCISHEHFSELPNILAKCPSLVESATQLISPDLLVELTELPAVRRPASILRNQDLFFDQYQPLSVVHSWLRLLVSMFPDRASLINIGKSYEGKDILGIRLGVLSESKRASPRQTVLIVGGAHAREWISISSVNYLIYHLVTSYGAFHLQTQMIEEFDWIFIPSLNPDGYVYSWTVDRLWKKNRQPTYLKLCRGFDLDRGFGFHFDTDARDDACSESFPGRTPWQAVEASALKNWVSRQIEAGIDIVAFLDLHSYSQQVLYPYSYSCDELPPTLETLQELGMGLSKAMRIASGGSAIYSTAPACEGSVATTNTTTTSTSSIKHSRNNGGSALDWFYHDAKVKYTFQIKLRDTGSYGFLLPQEYIEPTGSEVLAAVNYLGRFMLGGIGVS